MEFFKRILSDEEYSTLSRIHYNIAAEYRRFKIPKKNGKFRVIDAPSERLKRIQEKLLPEFYKLPVHPSAVGFRPDMSITTGALKHLNSKVLLNLDLKNFFPSCTLYHVTQLFSWYPNFYARIHPHLPPLTFKELDLLIVLTTLKGRLPQGAPTSPVLSNLIFRPIDYELAKMAATDNLVYTRYADDLTFSHTDINYDIGKITTQVSYVLNKSKFTINWKKFRITRPHRRMEVTGIVINERLSIPKKYVMRVKARLHQMEKRYNAGEEITELEKQQVKGQLAWLSIKYPRPKTITNKLKFTTKWLLKLVKKKPQQRQLIQQILVTSKAQTQIVSRPYWLQRGTEFIKKL